MIVFLFRIALVHSVKIDPLGLTELHCLMKLAPAAVGPQDQLMAFLAELTDEDSGEEGRTRE